ncbi:hypothetical protein ACOACO_07665 [Nocardioides sp. CPCC 205120]|uniref:hypothetical protein n=1 Tax=Nocardioides sp. CPCC 205120 TaxID=3406462 RepID=UPI003B50B871
MTAGGPRSRRVRDQRGSAVIELTWLGIILLVPVVYIVLAVFDVQRGAFAVTSASRTAARAYALSDDHASGQAAADAAARLAFSDQGIEEPVGVKVTCSAPDGEARRTGPAACRLPGAIITVVVDSAVELPYLPDVLGGGAPTFALEATHSVPYGQFREAS